MILKTEKNHWICASNYDERQIPKSAGCRWNPEKKRWWTNDVAVAQKLIEYADENAKKLIAAEQDKKNQKIAASAAVDADISIPAPAGREYYPFQRAGIAYALARKNCLIADEMGLGKTIQAIGVINQTKPQKTLIICPASLKLNWRNELTGWLTENLTVAIADGKTFPATQIVICNYDIIKKYQAEITAQTWDLLICDEAHYLKNHNAQRTKNTLSIQAARKIFLTGTPVLNRPAELHPLLKSLQIDFAQNWKYYMTRFCAAEKNGYGWDCSGASNLDELGEKLRSTIMVRRLKSQVLTELPEKIKQIITLPANGASAEIEDEKKQWEEYQTSTADLREKIVAMKKSGEAETQNYKTAIAELKSFFAAFAKIAILRHKTALKKVDYIVEEAKNIVESAGAVVIFAHHKDVLKNIADKLNSDGVSAIVVDGDTPLDARQKAVDDFQAGKIQVFVGSIRACGVGITLTAASNVIFTELDWTPAILQQAEDRCHRIGQKNTVLVKMMVFENTIDAMLAKKIIEKEEIIETILEVNQN